MVDLPQYVPISTIGPTWAYAAAVANSAVPSDGGMKPLAASAKRLCSSGRTYSMQTVCRIGTPAGQGCGGSAPDTKVAFDGKSPDDGGAR